MKLAQVLENYGIDNTDAWIDALGYHPEHQYSSVSLLETIEFYAIISVMRLLTEDDKNIIEVITPDTPVAHLNSSIYLFPSKNAKDIIFKSAQMLFNLAKRGVIDYKIVARDRYVAIQEWTKQ